MGVRVTFVVTFASIVYRGVRGELRRGGSFALLAAVTIGVVLFPSELTALHVPRIWFPWGVGVSRSEIASVVFDGMLFVLLLQRLRSYAQRIPAGVPASI
jgi:hypothetical protein